MTFQRPYQRSWKLPTPLPTRVPTPLPTLPTPIPSGCVPTPYNPPALEDAVGDKAVALACSHPAPVGYGCKQRSRCREVHRRREWRVVSTLKSSTPSGAHGPPVPSAYLSSNQATTAGQYLFPSNCLSFCGNDLPPRGCSNICIVELLCVWKGRAAHTFHRR